MKAKVPQGWSIHLVVKELVYFLLPLLPTFFPSPAVMCVLLQSYCVPSAVAVKTSIGKREEAKICKAWSRIFRKMLQTHIRIPIAGREKANLYNGIFSRTGLWSVQEKMHCTKNAFFKNDVRRWCFGHKFTGKVISYLY